MLPLRYTGFWRVAGGFALLAVFAAAVMPAIWFWTPQVGRHLIGVDKWLHMGTFAVLALWFSGQYTRRAYWKIALSLLFFGIAIELCQRMLVYRSADLKDLTANVAGILAGLGIALAGMGGWSLRVEEWLTRRRLRA